MTIKKAQNYLLNKGYTFKNTRGRTKPIVFKLFGRQWTTNPLRMNQYSMDDESWVIIKFPLWKKLFWILIGKVNSLPRLKGEENE